MSDGVLALAPLLLLALLIAGLRWPAQRAALAALALLAAGLWWRHGAGALGAFAAPVGASAVVLAATVGYTLFFGLLLHHLLDGGGGLAVLLRGMRALGSTPLERLQWVLLVFGPLLESISGFGLGVMIAAPLLLALGYAPTQAMTLSLLSQLAVPWGALAIGMALGATLADLPLAPLGTATAVLVLPGYCAFWGAALWLSGAHGGTPWRTALRSLPPLLVLGVGVWATNRWAHPALGGIGGTLLVGGWLRMTRDRAAPGAEAVPPAPLLLRAALPYALLIALLLVTRFVAPLREWLATTARVSLPGTDFSVALLYNPGASLAVACLAAALLLFRPGRRLTGWGTALRSTWRQWLRAVTAVLLLVLLARLLHEAGLLRALADTGAALPPLLGALAVPALAGLGGFLTGSVAGADALFINLQVALAGGWGWPVLWVAALQNALAAAFTALSPARLVFAAVVTGQPGAEGAALRRLLPLAAVLLLLGTLLLLPWSRETLELLQPWLVGATTG